MNSGEWCSLGCSLLPGVQPVGNGPVHLCLAALPGVVVGDWSVAGGALVPCVDPRGPCLGGIPVTGGAH